MTNRSYVPRARCLVLVTFIGTLAVEAPHVRAQVSDRNPKQPDFAVGTTTVVLDVVVRDRSQRPVDGLTADDFEVLENGRRQVLTAFQVIGADAARASAATSLSAAIPAWLQVGNPPAVVAVVFEELGPEGRRLALDGARQLVASGGSPPDLIGVYTLRPALEEIMPFSRGSSTDEVTQALEDAAQRPGCPLWESTPGAVRAMPTPCAPANEEHRFRGVTALDGLRTLVEALAPFPGRKSVALFSEGLDLVSGCRGQFCDDRMSRFRDVIAAAASANVAFYTFDTAGLRLHTMATGQLMEEPRAALSVLARATGGAFVEGTNDLRPGVRRLHADMRSYYLLAYTMPPDDPPDRQRSVRVRVKRRGMQVLVREGYTPTPP
jgi:VWFA-related protein